MKLASVNWSGAETQAFVVGGLVARPVDELAALIAEGGFDSGHPGDVVVGSLIGATVGQMVGWGLSRVPPSAHHREGSTPGAGS